MQESSDVGRSIIAALQNTRYFKVTRILHTDAEFDRVLASGEVLFAVEIPAGFERSAPAWRDAGAADRGGCHRSRRHRLRARRVGQAGDDGAGA